jgi:hypothetical protein
MSDRRLSKWLKRLEKLIAAQPPGTWVFVDGGGWGATINLMKFNADGKKALAPSGGYDQEYILGTVETVNWDGGGW